MRTISRFIQPLAASVAVGALLAGNSAGAFAADAQSQPIYINDVQAISQSTTDRSTMPIATQIAFTNEYSAAATHVVFLLESRGAVVDRFDDVGTFAPGVLVRHRFPEIGLGGATSVVVAAASFADGTTWQNSAVAEVPATASEPIAGSVPADTY
jgi:hypothetical protein